MANNPDRTNIIDLTPDSTSTRVPLVGHSFVVIFFIATFPTGPACVFLYLPTADTNMAHGWSQHMVDTCSWDRVSWEIAQACTWV